MVRLVLFDIDGTLIESGGAGVKAFAQTCAMEFRIPNGIEGLSFAGRTDPSIVREFFVRYEIEPSVANFRRFFDCYVFWLDYMLEHTTGRVLPGVRELIEELANHPAAPALGLLTGNIRLGAELKLSHFHLWGAFKTGGFGDDHENRDEIAAIARQRGCRFLKQELKGEEILVIGDTPLDIRCGKAIGAKVLAVATASYKEEQLEAHRPTWTVKDLREVSAKELLNSRAR